MEKKKHAEEEHHHHEHEHEHEEEEKEETLVSHGVMDKYKEAGKIANFVLEKVISKCLPDANIAEVCAFGDKLIEEELHKVYNKKKLEKGLAFPTCISCNEVCGHYSPLASDSLKLKAGDIAKVDLGVHIDGFIALVAHTIVVGASADKPVEGRAADVILAAHNAIEGAYRLLRPGTTNSEVTKLVQKVAESYKCNPLEGVLSHELKKHLIDGNNCIINKETFEQKVEEREFQVNEVYGLDVIVSTGEGKPKESEFKTTVFKRAIEKAYNLKTKSGRAFYNELINKYPSLCFSIRSFEDEITAKMGVKESMEHDLLNTYPVLVEKPGEIVAHFKYTVLVVENRTFAITGLPLDLTHFKSDKKIEDEGINKLLSMNMDKKAQNSLKKKAKKEGEKKGEAQSPTKEEVKAEK